ncbi:MAG: glycosyltransferase family 39 protein [Candidatus Parvarchaeota archaeon]|nr:glycosyltransferase family 39 protein [Candidatus Jingweiarchaeum tengchongense]MCW1304172.1 glycosyltransferase family 39 protein [Candidatus Jingweiarchaeum tengchongense]MCW1310692.1 glycosyltransferase family 39 protein [Candidatus Jingweiarchaeum tengchongense]
MEKIEKWIIEHKLFFVVTLSVISRIFLYRYYKMMTWDGAAFVMNAKYFLGHKIYFELIRPPIFPLLLGVGLVLGDIHIIPIIISILSIIVTFLLAEKLFDDRTAIISVILLALNPLHLINSGFFLAEITSLLFLILSLLFFIDVKKMKKDAIKLYISSFFFTLSFLTKYQNFLFIIPAILILYKKGILFKKETFFSSFIILLTVSPWLSFNFINYGDPFESIKYAILYPSEAKPEPIFFYLTKLREVFGFWFIVVLISLILGLRKLKEENYLILYSFIFIYLIAASIFPHKEERYLLPIVPFPLIISAKFLIDLLNLKLMKNVLLRKMCVSIFVLLLISYFPQIAIELNSNKVLKCYSNIINAANYVSGTNGTVIAPNWPLIAYYGNVKTIPFTYEPKDFDWYVSYYNVSYVIVSLEREVLESFGSSAGESINYVVNRSFFDHKDYLVMEKELKDECGIFLIYGVRNWTY